MAMSEVVDKARAMSVSRFMEAGTSARSEWWRHFQGFLQLKGWGNSKSIAKRPYVLCVSKRWSNELYFFAWPKVLNANTALFRLAQNNCAYNGSWKNTLRSNRIWCVHSDWEFLQILHFLPGPKVHGANFVFFRLAQKYLVQIQHFFAWPKTILQKYNGSCKNALKSNRFLFVNSDCEILQILHFCAWPKST